MNKQLFLMLDEYFKSVIDTSNRVSEAPSFDTQMSLDRTRILRDRVLAEIAKTESDDK